MKREKNMKYISPCMYEGMSHKKISYLSTRTAHEYFAEFVTSKKNFTCQTIIFFLNEVYIPLQKYASQHQAASIIFQVCKALLKDATHDEFKIVLS